MKRQAKRFFAVLMLLFLAVTAASPVAYADEDPVAAVTAQLQALDTLQEMQDARLNYPAGGGHYDINTTNGDTIASHLAARTGYETYVSEMFAARLAAQQAYDALTEEQKAQVDPELAALLTEELSTVWNFETCTVTPRFDEYQFEAVRCGTGYAYEVSNHMIAGNIPQTFILVDTSDGKTSWTADGPYVPGESNYEVLYCCDVETGMAYDTDYRRLNLEDSSYYSEAQAMKIRGILQNAYPYVTIEEMKQRMIEGGLDAEFVASLTRSDIISAVQMAVWTYANTDTLEEQNYGYFATINVPVNDNIYFHALHDFTNECWDWLPGKRQRTFDAMAQYRVNNLIWYLCNQEAVAADEDSVVISSIDITRAELLPGGEEDLYEVGLYVHLNGKAKAEDDLVVTVTSFSENEDGTRNITDTVSYTLAAENKIGMMVEARAGDTIEAVVEGTQFVENNVYFYEGEGGRDVSQCLVGVSSGETHVRAVESLEFRRDINMGLRIYKTANGSGLPISEIEFRIYNVTLEEGEILGEKPTEEEIARFAVEENLAASVITDVTGYAAAELPEGTYMVVEIHNADKVLACVDPFYVSVPMPVEKEIPGEDGSVEIVIEYEDIVSVYPKNEPVVPPPPPPPPPPPGALKGSFTIVKHEDGDETAVLDGAEFHVFRPAEAGDTDTRIITVNGRDLAVVQIMDGDEPLTLVSGEDGKAVSPELACGIYYVVEVKAPRGYKLLSEPVCVTVQPDTVTDAETYYIPNSRGPLLPETGGMGTKLLLVIGSAAVIGAGVLLVSRRRMRGAE